MHWKVTNSVSVIASRDKLCQIVSDWGYSTLLIAYGISSLKNAPDECLDFLRGFLLGSFYLGILLPKLICKLI